LLRQGIKNIAFRVDVSNEVGLGHLIRCKTLAEELSNENVHSCFILRDCAKDYSLISEESNIFLLPSNLQLIDEIPYINDCIKKFKTDIIITDLSNPVFCKNFYEYNNYISLLKERSRVVMFDGLEEDCLSRKFDVSADLIIIPYFGAHEKEYKISKDKLLLGIKYFTFRKEFTKKINARKKIKNKATNILISMGGSDPYGYTEKILSTINLIGDTELNVKVVLGSCFNKTINEKIKKNANNAAFNCKAYDNCSNMAELMLWSDLSILSSGLTKYESALLRTPTLALSLYKYHVPLMNKFAKSNSLIHLGFGKDLSNNYLASAIKEIINDYDIRNNMFINSRTFIDEKGSKRIVSRIKKIK